MRVAVFTDNDFEKVNGVTTTLRAVLAHAPPDIEPRVFTAADFAIDDPRYTALRSWGMGVPWYREMRMYWPRPMALLGSVRAFRPDLVHLTTPGPVGLAGRWVARRIGLPVVGSYHTRLGDYLEVLSGSPRLGRWFEHYVRWLYTPCRPLLVPTPFMAARLAARGYPRASLRIWSRGIDTASFAPERRSAALRERWRVSDRRPAILYAGRLSREKGLAIVEPIGRRLDRDRVPHRFVFVGAGPMRRDLERLCPDAVFTGALKHDDVAVAMASADVFLFPSTTDTLGNVVLEAQACGLPVLVADRGGPGENLWAGRTGFICDEGGIGLMVERLASLLRDPGCRAEMSRAAREFALGRQWPLALAALYGAWREVVAGRRPAEAPSELDLARPVRRPS